MTWTERLLLFAVILQTLEWLQVRDLYSAQGIWTMSEGRDLGLFSRHFPTLLAGRLAIAVMALIKPEAPLFLFLLISQILIVLRFRGAYNGGSDYVTTLGLIMIWLFHSFPHSAVVQTGCLLYLGLQISLSYFLSGIGKLPNPDWRTGEALPHFLLSGKYQVPDFWRNLARRNSWIIKMAGYAVLVFELSFPLALTNPNLCWLFIGSGVIFHLLNYQIFGLNRFFWIWISCYPALLETSAWISSHF